MLDKMQAVNAVSRYRKQVQGTENKKYVVELEVSPVNSKFPFKFPIGFINKHIEKPIYKVTDQVNPENTQVVDNFAKANASLAESFTKVAEENSAKICMALVDSLLLFKGNDIKIDNVDANKVVFTFIKKGASTSVTPQVFAKNWIIGEITEKAAE